jgi:hypothetical protein
MELFEVLEVAIFCAINRDLLFESVCVFQIALVLWGDPGVERLIIARPIAESSDRPMKSCIGTIRSIEKSGIPRGHIFI